MRADGDPVPVKDVARFMYSNDYTMGHFATMSLVPLLAEIIIRTYYKARNFKELYHNENRLVKGDIKLASMLASTHTLLATGNAIKVYLMGGNPTAFNWATFLCLGKSYFSWFIAQKERDSTISNFLNEEMTKIYAQAKGAA